MLHTSGTNPPAGDYFARGFRDRRRAGFEIDGSIHREPLRPIAIQTQEHAQDLRLGALHPEESIAR